ncbi:MAG: sigma-70 family RNA polymerase sigma factor [Candidatus Eisenbacteria bacterium]|uniref:Sigma-70 family RNA polymerase sigma factor n=1 Tax=Eiseniibacteriota bacterium TaxID=2212470 RepID=A0A849SVN5_UNCEI|nr:sigma-70 family RNA polymerase sigma factor [Candidatus Eisenbacteria bacterium]
MTGSATRERDDETLLRIAARDPDSVGSREAASELLRRYHRQVYLWCFRYVRDPDRAMDLTQDVLLRAYRAMSSFEGRSRFSSWLFVIARNCCLKAVSAPALLVDEDADPDAAEHPAAAPDAAYERAEDEERLRQLMMDKLDEAERRALWLRCIERLSVESITKVMGLENATGARALLQRARRRLRAALEESGRAVS